jgi:site-specific DNA recombinase
MRTVAPDPHDRKGENGVRRINDAEAPIVRRIFEEFAAGRSPRAIAKRLNEEGIPGPGGRTWGDTTIRGQAARGTGILNNTIYIGRLEWNRCSYVKNPQTGKKVARVNTSDAREVTEVAELRIIDNALWARVKARQAKVTFTVRRDEAGNALNRAHRTVYLLSGLLRCGICGTAYVAQGQGRFACSQHRRGGACTNGGRINGQSVEERVIAGLKEKLLAPDLVAAFLAEFERELVAARARAGQTSRELRARLQNCERQIANIVAVITDGRSNPALLKRLDELESEQLDVAAQIGALPADASAAVIPLPAGTAIYRRKIETLETALQDEAIRMEAIEILRSMIERVVVTPSPEGGLQVELYGDLARLITADEPIRQSGTKSKRPASDEAGRAVLSVVAGTRNCLYLLLFASDIPLLRANRLWVS